MPTSKDDIKSWLNRTGRDRDWLAEQCGSSKNTVNNWLSTNIKVPSKAIRIIETLMRADAEAERARNPAPPMSLVLEVEAERFDAYNRSATKRGMIIREWANEVLNEAAARDAMEEAASKTVQFQAGESWPGVNSSRSAAENDSMPAATISEKRKGGGSWSDGRGQVAAGSPIDAVEWAPEEVPKDYPEDHYVLKVCGQSMEPKIPDGSRIVVKEWRQQGFPKKGTIVVYSDGSGATLKVFGYRKAKEGEDADGMGNVPVLKSLNPAYSDVQTMEGGRLDAVFVEVIDG